MGAGMGNRNQSKLPPNSMPVIVTFPRKNVSPADSKPGRESEDWTFRMWEALSERRLGAWEITHRANNSFVSSISQVGIKRCFGL